MNLTTIVGHVGGRCKGKDEEQDAWKNVPAKGRKIKAKIKSHIDEIFAFVEKKNDARSFNDVEQGLIGLIFALGRLFLAYFLARREESCKGQVGRWLRQGFRKRDQERKYLCTFFGRVCFWMTYVRRSGGVGLHPLDLALRLTADGFSLLLMQLGTRLSTLVSYEQVTGLLLQFLSWSPS